MKKLAFLILAILPLIAFGQKAEIEFEQTSHNFGTIPEAGGPVSCDFKFKNKGDAPLILTNVRAGCGCTTPEWSREPILPGATGIIKVSYNPAGRPVPFTKSVTVNCNAKTSVVNLTIRGNVTRKPADPYQAYKYTLGDVKIATSNLYLGAITNKQKQEKEIEVINTGDQPATIVVTSPAKYMTATMTPSTLKKDEKGVIRIAYNAEEKNDWGFVSDKIGIKVNDKAKGEIAVSATINEDFSKYTSATLGNAPVATFSEKEATLDNIAKNTTLTHEFYIENTGKLELIVRKLKSSDEATSVNVAKSIIKPGKKNKVTVTAKTDDQPGKKIKIIQFTTNDPKNPVTTYRLIFNVK